MIQSGLLFFFPFSFFTLEKLFWATKAADPLSVCSEVYNGQNTNKQEPKLAIQVFSSYCLAKTAGGNQRRRLQRMLRFQAHVWLFLLTCVGSSY